MNNNGLVQLGNELEETDAALNTLREREKELEKALKEIQKSQAQIPLLKEQCEQDRQLLTRLKSELAGLGQDRSKSVGELKQLQALSKPTDKPEEQLKVELKQVEERQKAIVSQRGANEKSLDNYEMLIDRGVCPTCERPIDDPSVYTEKRDKMRQEANAFLDKERQTEGEKRSLDSLLQSLRRYNATIENLPRAQKEIDDRAKNIDDKTNEIKHIESHLSELQRRLSEVEEVVKPNEKLLKEFEQTKQQIKEKEGLRHNKDTDMALLKQKNKGLEEDKKRREDEIRKGEAALGRISLYREVTKYLGEYFIPTVGRIETIVLQKIHGDFNDNFQKYFSIIIGFTEIEAYIDEDFSVVIMQGGYETPYYRLSGGERTSLALAYRLALNQLIRKLSKIERGLLILDEPTEGLSYAQVLNLREVFEDLDCNQIILVSHEPQFLGFSDKVLRVDKVDHISTISSS